MQPFVILLKINFVKIINVEDMKLSFSILIVVGKKNPRLAECWIMDPMKWSNSLFGHSKMSISSNKRPCVNDTRVKTCSGEAQRRDICFNCWSCETRQHQDCFSPPLTTHLRTNYVVWLIKSWAVPNPRKKTFNLLILGASFAIAFQNFITILLWLNLL